MAFELRDIAWNEFKDKVNTKNLSIQFTENEREIFAFVIDGGLEWSTRILKGTPDADDFDNNFRSDANQVFIPKRKIHGDSPSGQEKVIRTTGIDESNSTSTPLGADGIFTGEWVNIEGYSNLNVLVFTDQASAEDGFIVDHSTDGVNIDDSDEHTVNAMPSPTQKGQFSFPLPGKFYRIRYINGATAQTEFRLQSKLHSERPKPSSHRVGQIIDGENDAELTKSVITGQDPNGVFKNVQTDDEGNFKIVAASGASIIPTLGTNLKYDDMNVNTGGIARGTTIASTSGWVKVYDSTAVDANASGLMISFLINLEAFNSTDSNKRWEVRLVDNGEEVFGPTGVKSTDLINPAIYGYQDDPTKAAIEWNGFMVRGSVLRWEGPNNLPLTYEGSGIQIFVRKFGDTKVFNGGLVTLTRN